MCVDAAALDSDSIDGETLDEVVEHLLQDDDDIQVTTSQLAGPSTSWFADLKFNTMPGKSGLSASDFIILIAVSALNQQLSSSYQDTLNFTLIQIHHILKNFYHGLSEWLSSLHLGCVEVLCKKYDQPHLEISLANFH
jgi:hypothetical protein